MLRLPIVISLFRIKDGTSDVDMTIDEVAPTDFNGTLNAGSPMVLTLVDVQGEDSSSVVPHPLHSYST